MNTDNIEVTPEEDEAFNNVDTASRQFESLSGKPDERLEAAYDLYVTGCETSNTQPVDYWCFVAHYHESRVRYLAIVDKTGYRIEK